MNCIGKEFTRFNIESAMNAFENTEFPGEHNNQDPCLEDNEYGVEYSFYDESGELPKVKTLGFLLHRPLSQEMFD